MAARMHADHMSDAFCEQQYILKTCWAPLRRFLGGVLDFTGELNRYAIAKATKRDIPEVQRCRDIVESLMGEFLQVGSV